MPLGPTKSAGQPTSTILRIIHVAENTNQLTFRNVHGRSEAARNHLYDAERYRSVTAGRSSDYRHGALGASGIAGNKETVRTERGGRQRGNDVG